MAALRWFAAVVLAVMGFAVSVAGAQTLPTGPVHLGVATCAGSNCHGATERPAGSAVPGDEYIIWSKRDKHRKAYTVLLEPRAIRMARALGLPDAAHQKLCLDCHADNVPPAQRGPQFQLSDGVGCEACHGGASGWLGVHISGASHRANLAAGLYPLEQPVPRAEKCLGCHFGDATHFVDHRLLGAGHPRLAFELDTYTAIEPAHFVVDQSYIERKGRISDMQVWGAGQAVALVKQMDALLDPKLTHRGLFPEFAFYDCQSCHHPYDAPRAPLPTGSGLGPGTVKLNDADAVMLELAAARVAPEAAPALKAQMRELVQAAAGDGEGTVQHDARAVRDIAARLLDQVANHDYTDSDLHALADAIIALGRDPDEWRFSHAEQTTMALESVIAALKSSGRLGEQQTAALKKATDALYASFTSEASFRPDAFAAALRQVQRAIGR